MRGTALKNKYHAKRTVTKDGAFDSKKELNRWIELSNMALDGEIKNLQRQVPYELIPSQYINGKCIERACTYKADFVYFKDGDLIVEDVKSAITRKNAEYIIKRKLMLHRYGIRIVEV